MTHTTAFLAIGALSLGLYGCGSPSASEAEPKVQPSASDASHSEHADHEHGHSEHGDHEGNAMSAMSKMKAELARLSPADAASAEKQHICPVSGEMLGTMGPPIKIDVKGQEVWICCDGCREKLLANPDEYLAKLKN